MDESAWNRMKMDESGCDWYMTDADAVTISSNTRSYKHFGAYHRPPDGNFYVYVTGHIQSWTNLVIPSIHGDIAKKLW